MKKRFEKRLFAGFLACISLISMFTLLVLADIEPIPGTDTYIYTLGQDVINSFPFADAADAVEGAIQIHFWAGAFYSAPGVSATVTAYDKTPWEGDANIYLEGRFAMTDGTVYEDQLYGENRVYMNLESRLWKYPLETRHYSIATNYAADATSVLVTSVGES